VKLEPQSGLAIGPIIFVVAVLAILGAAIAAGSMSYNGGTGTESASTQAGAIIREAELLQQGVQRVFVENGCTDVQISFSNPVITALNGSDVYANTNAPANKSCNVFSPSGGGLTFPNIKASTIEITDGAYFFIQGFDHFWGDGNPIVGDLAAFLPIDSSAVCQKINSLLGLGSYTGSDWYNTNGHFNGNNYGNGGYNSLVDDGGNWPRPTPLMGCVSSVNLGQGGGVSPVYAPYFFYVVLLVR
jgi:hypothetical protein